MNPTYNYHLDNIKEILYTLNKRRHIHPQDWGLLQEAMFHLELYRQIQIEETTGGS
jgi:hypothetical protein